MQPDTPRLHPPQRVFDHAQYVTGLGSSTGTRQAHQLGLDAFCTNSLARSHGSNFAPIQIQDETGWLPTPLDQRSFDDALASSNKPVSEQFDSSVFNYSGRNQDPYRHQTDFNTEFLNPTPSSIELLGICNLDIDMLVSNPYYEVETFDLVSGISAQILPDNESSSLEGTFHLAFEDNGAESGSSSSTPNSTKSPSALSSPSSQDSPITCTWPTCEKTFLSVRD